MVLRNNGKNEDSLNYYLVFLITFFVSSITNFCFPQSEMRLVLFVFDGSPGNIGSGKSLAKSGMSFIIFILPSLFCFKKERNENKVI